MKIFYILLIAVTSVTTSAFASELGPDAIFSSANKSYIAGDYDKAITLYKEVHEKEGDSAELLFNMGNTYYKKGDIGMAVLFLERASWLEPGNADIEKNLNAVRNNTGLMLEEESLINRYAGKLTLNQWCIAASTLLFLFSTLMCTRAVLPQLFHRNTFRHLTIVLAALGIASLYGAVNQYLELDRAIVVSSEAEVLISPFDGADQTASLKTGRMVYVLSEHDNYLSVKENSGTTGWVKKSQVRKIIP